MAESRSQHGEFPVEPPGDSRTTTPSIAASQDAHAAYVDRIEKAGQFTVDDDTLTQRVESEIYRDQTLPKGPVTIHARDGVVILRGALEQHEQMRALEAAVRRVPGVRDVENLLHLSDTAAPNKRSALEASEQAEETMQGK
ncbi:MAG: BON domain-containing protein [Thermomicrobia bacterium]|nr:BON domain-containing protein [Thermomicrobia bacterium]